MYGAWMGRALELASRAAWAGDVPVGALVVAPVSGRGAAGSSRRAADVSGRGAGPSGQGAAPARAATALPGEGASWHIIGEGWNIREVAGDPLGHAEMTALRQASAHRGGWRLDDCALVVTLEPCPMCAGAAAQARISRIVLGAWDPKAGACGSVWDIVRDPAAPHRIEVVGGVREAECGAALREFFEARR